MSLELKCKCGHQVPFTEEDRGFEVYCPSCSRACSVPGAEVAVPAGAATGRRSLFSAEAQAELESAVVNEVECLCGQRVAVRLEDYGASVYCPRCQAEISVGRTWSSGPALTAHRVENTDDTSIPVSIPRLRWLSSPAGLITAALLGVAIGLGAYWTRERWSPALATLVVPPTPVEVAEAGEFDPAHLTLAMIGDLPADEQPFRALLRAYWWRRGLDEHGLSADDPRFAALDHSAQQLVQTRQKDMLGQIEGLTALDDPLVALESAVSWHEGLHAFQVAESDPRRVRLAALVLELAERADPITIERIDRLLTESAAEQALTQAYQWQAELDGRRAPSNDPRRGRLDAVTAELLARLTPSLTPPPHVDLFRKVTQTAADQLEAKDMPGAERSLQQAGGLLQLHGQDLAPLARRYLSLKNKFDRLQQRALGVEGVRRMFDQVEAALRDAETARDAKRWDEASDRVTAAIEANARARRAAFLTRLKPEEIESFEARHRGQQTQLTFARGWRAVFDAERLQTAGLGPQRDKAALRAYALLQGLPEDQVRPWLARVKTWYDAQKAAGFRASQAPASGIGVGMDLRDRFEDCLERFAQADTQSLVAICLDSEPALRAAGESFAPLHARVGELAFDILEPTLIETIEQSGEGEAFEATLVQVGRELQRLSPWKDSGRWKALDALIRQRGLVIAQARFAEARRLAEQLQLEGALERADQAIPLADAKLVAEVGRARSAWQHEIKLRNDLQAQDKAWKQIESLRGDPERLLAYSGQLDEFLRLWPESSRRSEAEGLRAEARQAIDREFNAKLDQARQLAAARRWTDLVRLVKLLEQAASSPMQREGLAPILAMVDRERREAEGALNALGSKKHSANEQILLEVFQVAQRVVVVDPDNADAAELFKLIDEKIKTLAERYATKARTYRLTSPEFARELANKALTLDPQGPHGKAAREVLQGLPKR